MHSVGASTLLPQGKVLGEELHELAGATLARAHEGAQARRGEVRVQLGRRHLAAGAQQLLVQTPHGSLQQRPLLLQQRQRLQQLGEDVIEVDGQDVAAGSGRQYRVQARDILRSGRHEDVPPRLGQSGHSWRVGSAARDEDECWGRVGLACAGQGKLRLEGGVEEVGGEGDGGGQNGAIRVNLEVAHEHACLLQGSADIPMDRHLRASWRR